MSPTGLRLRIELRGGERWIGDRGCGERGSLGRYGFGRCRSRWTSSVMPTLMMMLMAKGAHIGGWPALPRRMASISMKESP